MLGIERSVMRKQIWAIRSSVYGVRRPLHREWRHGIEGVGEIPQKSFHEICKLKTRINFSKGAGGLMVALDASDSKGAMGWWIN